MKRFFAFFVACGSVLVAACSGPSGDPVASSTHESLSAGQKCALACNQQYVACDIGDGCGCYDVYVHCMQRCQLPPAFDPPEGCGADAAPPPPPPQPPNPCSAGQFYCAGCFEKPDVCLGSCLECNRYCGLPPGPGYCSY